MATRHTPLTIERLKKRKDFLEVAATKHRFLMRDMVVQYRDRKDDTAFVRVGFTVTNKQGNAVVRNRIRRRLREAARSVMQERARGGFDYVLLAKTAYAECPYEKIIGDLHFALQHIHRAPRQKNTAPANESLS